MKNYIKLIPLTGFATAIALGSSMNAGESTPKGTSMKESQRHSEPSAHAANKNDQTNSRPMAASELLGMTVENRQGESVGNVDEVYLNLETREVLGVVVSTGGFLGMGDRKTLFGMRELSFDREHENVVLDYNRDQIGEIAEFKTDDQSVFEELGDRLDRLGNRVGNYISGDDDADTEGRYAGRSSDMTVFNQGNSSDEIAMTASIRTAIRQNKALSSRANNVTIITNKDKVVLRGEVDSVSEKTTLEGIAHNKAGRQNVTSELIVAVR